MRSKPIDSTCGTCGAPTKVLPYLARKLKRSFCNRECWAKAPNRRTADRNAEYYKCPRCDKKLHRDLFNWFELADGTLQHRGYCISCEASARAEYYLANKDAERTQHQAWRDASEKKRDNAALRWHFTRQFGSIRRRSIRDSLPECNFDADYLVAMYVAQEGKCHYTGAVMYWGKGGHERRHELMSIDKLTPVLGYTRGNVVLCTSAANLAKHNRTENEFYEMCESVVKLRASRKAAAEK